MLVVAMIEEAAALDHLGPMLSVAGFDAVHIGPKDLWQSMGMPSDEVVDAAIARIAAAVHTSGKYLSLQLRASGDLDRQIERCAGLGANMISIPLLGMLLREGKRFVTNMKARQWPKHSRL